MRIPVINNSVTETADVGEARCFQNGRRDMSKPVFLNEGGAEYGPHDGLSDEHIVTCSLSAYSSNKQTHPPEQDAGKTEQHKMQSHPGAYIKGNFL